MSAGPAPPCGKTWNTAQTRVEEYEALLPGIRRYRLLVLVPPLVLAAILIPLAVLVDVRFAFLLFLLEIAFALFVIPPLRHRASSYVLTRTPTWNLRPE